MASTPSPNIRPLAALLVGLAYLTTRATAIDIPGELVIPIDLEAAGSYEVTLTVSSIAQIAAPQKVSVTCNQPDKSPATSIFPALSVITSIIGWITIIYMVVYGVYRLIDYVARRAGADDPLDGGYEELEAPPPSPSPPPSYHQAQEAAMTDEEYDAYMRRRYPEYLDD